MNKKIIIITVIVLIAVSMIIMLSYKEEKAYKCVVCGEMICETKYTIFGINKEIQKPSVVPWGKHGYSEVFGKFFYVTGFRIGRRVSESGMGIDIRWIKLGESYSKEKQLNLIKRLACVS